MARGTSRGSLVLLTLVYLSVLLTTLVVRRFTWSQVAREFDAIGPDAQTLWRRGPTCGRLPAAHDMEDAPKLAAVVYLSNVELDPHRWNVALTGTRRVDEIIFCGSTQHVSDAMINVTKTIAGSILLATNSDMDSCIPLAMRSSAAEIFLLLDETDLLPFEDDWLIRSTLLMDSMPSLAILGGAVGLIFSETNYHAFSGVYSDTHVRGIPFSHNGVSVRFMFTHCISSTPIFIRSSAMERVADNRALRWSDPMRQCLSAFKYWEEGWSVGLVDSEVPLKDSLDLRSIDAGVLIRNHPDFISSTLRVIELNKNLTKFG
eukprot:CAMPEP_0184678678 /NCGR_PEP_ID=MMETSP0312-20130426/1459_1 /TAXON_ID=31354 /ORGANISM="Compsopogon coeruleus, Strain SAG 36.94" /LENGTH=316 /DNA_ID=CAMNT_0027127593 /DNA_START=241 /DNA_END=1191 /DNA_ORIENTATION=+